MTDYHIEQALKRVEQKLDSLYLIVRLLVRLEIGQMAKMDDVITALGEETNAVIAVGQVVDNLVALVQAAGTDQAKIDAALATITANRDAIVAATLRGTPAAPPV